MLDRLHFRSDARQCERLLDWADRFDERSWAIESAAGLGHLLSQQLAREHLADMRRLDCDLDELRARMTAAVTAADTTVTDIFGIGPIAACLILGHTGDVGRFATADRYASYNATAPIEASSGPTVRHRLNQRGDRQLNHAMHIAAIVQVRFASPYYQRKIAEGMRPKEAMRSLKRRISDDVYRHLIDDAARHRA